MKAVLVRWVLPLSIPLVLAGLLFMRGKGAPSAVAPPTGKLERHTGGTVEYASFSDRVRVVNFWATWCAPCKEELPALLRVMDAYEGRGAQLLAVNQDGGDQLKEQVEEFLLTHPAITSLRTRVYYGDDAFLRQFHVDALPTTYVLDRHGAVVKTFLGAVTEEGLKRALDRALDAR